MKVYRAELVNVDLPRRIRSSLLIMVEVPRSLFQGLPEVKCPFFGRCSSVEEVRGIGTTVQVLESRDVNTDMGYTFDSQNGLT